MPRPALMVQGTGSDVGKSVIVAGLARAFTRRGLRVLPFKPQNMSNNAAVTEEGGEIGRAQALQARAAGVAPRVDMNPVLLKPEAERCAQVIVQGRIAATLSAQDYHLMKPSLLPRVLDSFQRLEEDCDLVLIEGAGSPAEVNLRAFDIANMGFALAAKVPVLLLGDIDRGGVIAQLVGTHVLLALEERALVKGYVINKFRGDLGLFSDALDILRARMGLRSTATPTRNGAVAIAVPLLPHIANFDDLDPLRAESGVELDLVVPGRPLPVCDLVILPGSKATRADLAVLRSEGWDIDLHAHARRGGCILGICAGYQMLGRRIADPHGIEGAPGVEEGLGLLEVETEFAGEKRLVAAQGFDTLTGALVRGYEMHLGRTAGIDAERPMLRLDGRADGAVSRDGRIAGCHLHGLFASDAFRRAFLARLGGAGDPALEHEARIDAVLESLARHLELHLDLDALLAVAHAR